ncbi:MAG TPA: glycoside hydrolase family 3 N-terminal domain-containing protein, partial [Jatrophihabitans sp.]
VILTGRSTAGISASRNLTDQLRTAAAGSPSGNVGLFVACDQEGGMVQVLRGPGFSDMPSAVEQAQWPTEQLRASARIWGQQLTAAGVNVDLGPVLDTVPPDFVGRNPPIDALHRQYGSTPLAVAQQGTAVAQGLTDAHVIPTVKHFPGLGRVTRNTDFSAGVIDTSTVRHDPFFAPFGAALKATDPFVMVSSAIYRNIDARQPAAFSPTVIGQLLRGDLGFGGVVISDDLGKSVQVKALTPSQRAVRFFGAGGDLLLDVFPFQIPQMIDAVTLRAQQDRAFYNTVNAAALTVLRAKQAAGLIRR